MTPWCYLFVPTLTGVPYSTNSAGAAIQVHATAGRRRLRRLSSSPLPSRLLEVPCWLCPDPDVDFFFLLIPTQHRHRLREASVPVLLISPADCPSTDAAPFRHDPLPALLPAAAGLLALPAWLRFTHRRRQRRTRTCRASRSLARLVSLISGSEPSFTRLLLGESTPDCHYIRARPRSRKPWMTGKALLDKFESPSPRTGSTSSGRSLVPPLRFSEFAALVTQRPPPKASVGAALRRIDSTTSASHQTLPRWIHRCPPAPPAPRSHSSHPSLPRAHSRPPLPGILAVTSLINRQRSLSATRHPTPGR